MRGISPFFWGLLLTVVGLPPALADQLGSSHGLAPTSESCRTGLDGVTTCIRIRGYVRAGGVFPAPSATPVGGAFAPPRFGYSPAGLGSEPQPGGSFGPVRVYIDGSDPKEEAPN
jgi:hypothetical protein